MVRDGNAGVDVACRREGVANRSNKLAVLEELDAVAGSVYNNPNVVLGLKAGRRLRNQAVALHDGAVAAQLQAKGVSARPAADANTNPFNVGLGLAAAAAAAARCNLKVKLLYLARFDRRLNGDARRLLQLSSLENGAPVAAHHLDLCSRRALPDGPRSRECRLRARRAWCCRTASGGSGGGSQLCCLVLSFDQKGLLLLGSCSRIFSCSLECRLFVSCSLGFGIICFCRFFLGFSFGGSCSLECRLFVSCSLGFGIICFCRFFLGFGFGGSFGFGRRVGGIRLIFSVIFAIK